MRKPFSFDQPDLFEPKKETIKEIYHSNVLGNDFVIYGTFDNPSFLAKDVAGWIEHSNHRVMLDSVDADEKFKAALPVNNPYGGYQIEEQWFLTEDGLYEVLMLSRKPIAKQFKKQVKKILREVRSRGFYATPQAIDQIIRDPGAFLQVVQALKDAKDRSKCLEDNLDAACKELAQKDDVICELRPKAEVAEAFLISRGNIGVSACAKNINSALGLKVWGQKRMFAWLIAEGYLNLDHSPSQRAVSAGFMATKQGVFKHGNYMERFSTPKITPKGQAHFFERIKKQKESGILEAYLK